MSKKDHKLTVLQAIRDSKSILFGAFTDKLSKDKKNQEWKTILNQCQAFGLVSSDKDYTYVRDTFWSNIKRSTLAKTDNAKNTGAPGGKDKKLTPIDDLVLEIIGKDSPITNGIGIQEPLVVQNDDQCGHSDNAEVIIPDATPTPQTLQYQPTHSNIIGWNKRVKIIRRGSAAHTEHTDNQILKKKKLELQIEYLQLKKYKMTLESLELEQKLNLTPSSYTRDLVSSGPILEKEKENIDNHIFLISKDNIVINEDGTQTLLI